MVADTYGFQSPASSMVFGGCFILRDGITLRCRGFGMTDRGTISQPAERDDRRLLSTAQLLLPTQVNHSFEVCVKMNLRRS